MANTPQEIQRLLQIIPFGKQNAIHAKDIARALNYPTGGNQVETRSLIRYAIQQGHTIISTPNKGYWRTNNKLEVSDYIHALVARSTDINTRSLDVKAAWNQANQNNQIP